MIATKKRTKPMTYNHKSECQIIAKRENQKKKKKKKKKKTLQGAHLWDRLNFPNL